MICNHKTLTTYRIIIIYHRRQCCSTWTRSDFRQFDSVVSFLGSQRNKLLQFVAAQELSINNLLKTCYVTPRYLSGIHVINVSKPRILRIFSTLLRNQHNIFSLKRYETVIANFLLGTERKTCLTCKVGFEAAKPAKSQGSFGNSVLV